MFNSLSESLTASFKKFRGKGKLTESDISDIANEIYNILINADVSIAVVNNFIKNVKKQALAKEMSKALNPSQQFIKIVNNELIRILGSKTKIIECSKKLPTIIMLAGLQGAGKTTLAGKLALHFKSEGYKPLLVACDLQRPNAVTQIKTIASLIDVDVYAPHSGVNHETIYNNFHNDGDSIEVARDSIKIATKEKYDIVIIDTAGRLSIDDKLMTEISKMSSVINPDEILFTIDSMTGQDAVNSSKLFLKYLNFTGIVLTKLDGDSSGGAALSVVETTGKPILFISTGEKLEDFEVFHPERMASRILNMGDLLTLIEEAQKKFDINESQRIATKIANKEMFNLEDFLNQMHQIKKLGSIKKILSMMPGNIRLKMGNFDENHMRNMEAIINSMTPLERKNPKIINGSRKIRISNGAGIQISAINQLLEKFFQIQKIMYSFSKNSKRNIDTTSNSLNLDSKKNFKSKKIKNKKPRFKNPAKQAAWEKSKELKKSALDNFSEEKNLDTNKLFKNLTKIFDNM